MRKRLIYIAVFILFLFLAFKYLSYNKKKNQLQKSNLYHDLTYALSSYVNQGDKDYNIAKFLEFAKDSFADAYFQIKENEWQLNLKRINNDSILLYEFGLNEKDDNAKNLILSQNISLGDIFKQHDIVIISMKTTGIKEEPDYIEIQQKKEIEAFRKFSDSLDKIEQSDSIK